MVKKIRLWEALVMEEICSDRKTAESWIMAGRVLVNDQRVDKAGQMIPFDSNIRVKGYKLKYVSRGGLKLEGALKDFHLEVANTVAIDCGASTGGFTDCLLQHGAAKVYAVDVGFGQLAGKLRVDPRVVNLERVNISEVDISLLDPKPTLATVDLSYLSLKKAIPIVAGLLENEGELVCLVKPLFEVNDSKARRTGVIENYQLYVEVLIDLVKYTNESLGFCVLGVTNSKVTGNKGTKEFFLHVSLDEHNQSSSSVDITEQIKEAVNQAMSLDKYRK